MRKEFFIGIGLGLALSLFLLVVIGGLLFFRCYKMRSEQLIGDSEPDFCSLTADEVCRNILYQEEGHDSVYRSYHTIGEEHPLDSSLVMHSIIMLRSYDINARGHCEFKTVACVFPVLRMHANMMDAGELETYGGELTDRYRQYGCSAINNIPGPLWMPFLHASARKHKPKQLRRSNSAINHGYLSNNREQVQDRRASAGDQRNSKVATHECFSSAILRSLQIEALRIGTPVTKKSSATMLRQVHFPEIVLDEIKHVLLGPFVKASVWNVDCMDLSEFYYTAFSSYSVEDGGDAGLHVERLMSENAQAYAALESDIRKGCGVSLSLFNQWDRNLLYLKEFEAPSLICLSAKDSQKFIDEIRSLGAMLYPAAQIITLALQESEKCPKAGLSSESLPGSKCMLMDRVRSAMTKMHNATPVREFAVPSPREDSSAWLRVYLGKSESAQCLRTIIRKGHGTVDVKVGYNPLTTALYHIAKNKLETTTDSGIKKSGKKFLCDKQAETIVGKDLRVQHPSPIVSSPSATRVYTKEKVGAPSH